MPDGPVSNQTIAAAEFSLQQAPIRSERLAQCPGVNLQCAFHDNGAGPDAVHQLVFGDKFASRLCKNFDDLEGTSTDRYGKSTNSKFAASEVYLALARRVNRLNALSKSLRFIAASTEVNGSSHSSPARERGIKPYG